MLKALVSVARYAVGLGDSQPDYSSSEEEDNQDANQLIDQIISEINSEDTVKQREPVTAKPVIQTKRDAVGKITRLTPTDGVIDSKYYFSRKDINLHLSVGVEVSYSAFRLTEEHEWTVTKIYTVLDENWDSELKLEENKEDQDEILDKAQDEAEKNLGSASLRTVLGTVKSRERRKVVVRDIVHQSDASGLKPVTRDTCFSLDDVVSDFTPITGDVVRMKCIVEDSENTVNASGDILVVKSLEPNRTRLVNGEVVKWIRHHEWGEITDENGTDIYFKRGSCEPGYIPKPKDAVTLECIEYDSSKYNWRALHVKPPEWTQYEERPRMPRKFNHEMDPKLLNNKENVVVQENTNFGPLPVTGSYQIQVSVTNDGTSARTVVNHYIATKPSHLLLISPKNKRIMLKPEETITFSFEYDRRMLGYFSEEFILDFGSFEIGRLIKWEVFNADIPVLESSNKDDKFYLNERVEMTQKALQVQQDRALWVPGIRPRRAPNFMRAKLKHYDIPKELSDCMISSVNGRASMKDASDSLKTQFPELAETLSSSNHRKRFHTLLFIDEKDSEIDMHQFIMERVCFVPSGEYLALTVPGLAEGRPSVIVGDYVIARSSCSSDALPFQGYVHVVKKNQVLLKFQPNFHSSYNGEDYNIAFQQSSAPYKKCHNALDKCYENHASLWLFPKGVKVKPLQVAFRESDEYNPEDSDHEDEKDANAPNNEDIYKNRRKELKWFNRKLNHGQKESVRNILQGEARPLPYIIFGPPGTGKTSTLVETILQIYTLIGDSRLLIATPSNSSANLMAERLLDSEQLIPGDLVRLIAYHLSLDMSRIPPRIIPYCATVDSSDSDGNKVIPEEVKSLNHKLISLYRITIGTCSTIGNLLQLGLPQGHYTHIIIDEAGQATEPEILIPLSFLAHESGQAIFAGDPLQLGPVVQSKLASSFGLGKSLLSRLLSRFPYERDPTGFPNTGGYDPRLVTRLSLNYRSLPDILELPSSLFYDSDLEPWVSDEDSYEARVLARATSHLNLPHSAVVFHGIRGSNLRDEDSPSFFNLQEAFAVVQYTQQLLGAEIKSEDIGIITPYQKQATKIRQLLAKFDGETINSLKVGSVEEFQGQERLVIILSTVRSLGATHLEVIGRNASRQLLGFVSSPERLNVSISRARALLIICGDPHVLAVDHYWREVVRYCFRKGSYIGVGIPKGLDDS